MITKTELEHIYISLMYTVDKNDIQLNNKFDDLQESIINNGINENEMVNVINKVYDILQGVGINGQI